LLGEIKLGGMKLKPKEKAPKEKAPTDQTPVNNLNNGEFTYKELKPEPTKSTDNVFHNQVLQKQQGINQYDYIEDLLGDLAFYDDDKKIKLNYLYSAVIEGDKKAISDILNHDESIELTKTDIEKVKEAALEVKGKESIGNAMKILIERGCDSLEASFQTKSSGGRS
jgi:hypothetical protein